MDQVPMRGMNLQYLKSGKHRPPDCANEIRNDLLNGRHRQRFGHRIPLVKVNGARRNRLPAVAAERLTAVPRFVHATLATGMRQLDPDLTALRPDKFDDPPQTLDMLVFPDPQIARRDAAFRSNGRGFRENQPGATNGPGTEMHQMPILSHAVMRRILTHGRNDNTVTKGNISYLKGRKQLAHKMLNLPIILISMRRAFRRLWLLCTGVPFLFAFSGKPRPTTEIVIAAAADLKFAMDSLIAVFSADNPSVSVKVVYGSSGNFFQQISNGAPFDLFFSADISYPEQLKAQGRAISIVHPYGTGQLVLWSKTIDPAIDKMNTLLNVAIKKIAIANPAHAPYGQRAEETLHFYRIYDQVKDRLVIGENIAQTAQYVQSGVADIGIIALSLALSPAMQQSGGKYWLIPAEAHQPLLQGFVSLPHAKDNKDVERFAVFMSSPTAIAILKTYGFGQPNPTHD
jgi:molybdate transport system substrate-binding protein